jgi:hypothetical protein
MSRRQLCQYPGGPPARPGNSLYTPHQFTLTRRLAGPPAADVHGPAERLVGAGQPPAVVSRRPRRGQRGRLREEPRQPVPRPRRDGHPLPLRPHRGRRPQPAQKRHPTRTTLSIRDLDCLSL